MMWSKSKQIFGTYSYHNFVTTYDISLFTISLDVLVIFEGYISRHHAWEKITKKILQMDLKKIIYNNRKKLIEWMEINLFQKINVGEVSYQ